MSLSLLPPVLWESVPFGDPDAFLDWNLQHWLAHIALAKKTNTPTYLLDSLQDDSFPHALMHQDVSLALQIPLGFDFAGYDLKDRESYEFFMLANAAHHQQLNAAAGL
jgi:hypothetical protein